MGEISGIYYLSLIRSAHSPLYINHYRIMLNLWSVFLPPPQNAGHLRDKRSGVSHNFTMDHLLYPRDSVMFIQIYMRVRVC